MATATAMSANTSDIPAMNLGLRRPLYSLRPASEEGSLLAPEQRASMPYGLRFRRMCLTELDKGSRLARPCRL